MSEASDLIERLEAETGKRIDENNGDNAAMAGLFGAVSRIMGQSPPSYRKCDDVAAGLFIRHRLTPQYKAEQEANNLLTSLLASGIPPDDIKDFMG